MRLSEARKSFLAHTIVDTLAKEGLAEFPGSDRLVYGEIKRVFEADHAIDEKIDVFVRRKIASLSRRVDPGTAEWEVLYRQYYAEEERRVRRI